MKLKFGDDFLDGAKAGIPIMLGYICVAFAYGMNVCGRGIPFWLAGIISMTNLASAGQFAGTNLILSHATYIDIIITTLIINARYFLMSVSVAQNLTGNYNVPKKLATAHGVTDEIFAVAVSKKTGVTPMFMAGLIVVPVFGWTLGTVLGGLFAGLLPTNIVNAMNIALYGMFIAIIIPPAKKSKPIMISILIATLISVIVYYIPVIKNFIGSLSVVVVAIIASAIMATFFPIGEEAANE